ncbi:hypothetical protein HUU53_04530 [Candidatus Micrarchaeota archaeon]|nr:hypothetical protein [Candidatus Micrarchaeota archaeon]
MINYKTLSIIFVGCFLAFQLGYALGPTSSEKTFQAVAISNLGEGKVIEFSLKSYPGTGKTLLSIENALFEKDTQESLQRARRLAEKYLGHATNTDYEFSILRENNLNGGSAGLEFALAIASNELNKKLKKEVVVSSAIDEELELIPVGGIDEKILAAIQQEKKIFIVSETQPIKYEEQLSQQIQIIRVKTLAEAIEIAFE